MKIEDITEIITGKTPPTEITEYFGGKYPFITPSDIPSFYERRIENFERHLSEKGHDFQKRLAISKNCTCFVAIGSTVGKMCLSSSTAFTNQQIHSLIAKKGKVKEDFNKTPYKNIEIANLRAFIERKLEQMIQQNVTRIDFAQRLQEIINTYNAGGSTNEKYFDELMNFTREMQDEDERHVREGLTEDELELFDLIKKDKMSQEETKKVKLAAKSLLHRLLEEHPRVLVQDWHKDSQTQRMVKSAVEEILHKNLPESYDRILFKKKCDNVFELIFDYASRGLKWAA